MSTVKISELVLLPSIRANTSNTIFLGVDLPTQVTGRFTATTLAQQLYANNALNVGNHEFELPNVLGQFAGVSDNYIQVNLQNDSGNGSSDYVITNDIGTDTTNYFDMGFAGSTYSYPGYTVIKPSDGYILVQGGTTSATPGGNLILGTVTQNRDIVFFQGGSSTSDEVGRFIYNTGFKLLKKPIIFADGTTQNSASIPADYSRSAYALANTNSNSITYITGVNIAQNTYASGAFAKANAALANATGTFAGDLTITGNIVAASSNTGGVTIANNVIYSSLTNQDLVIGQTTASANLVVNRNLNLAKELRVTGNINATNANLSNSIYIAGITISNNSIISTLTNQDFVIGQPSSTANLVINRTLNVSRDIIASGNLYANGVYSTTGPITTGNLIVNGATSMNGTANISGTLRVIGVLTGNAQVVLQNTNFSATESALTISASPTIALPANDGYMIHTSGKNGVPSRIVADSYGTGAYSVYASRTARGTVTSPLPVQNGDIIGRFSANGYGNTKFQQFGTGRIDFIAAENYTDAATGSQIKFWNCPTGSNTLTNILTLNGDSAIFTGVVNPQKGFIFTPRIPPGAQTAITIDYAADSMIKANLAADLTVSHTNFTTGKIVELWLVNTGGLTRTVTHGISSINSTTNSTTFTIPGTSSAYLRYFSIDGDLANTFVSVVHS